VEVNKWTLMEIDRKTPMEIDKWTPVEIDRWTLAEIKIKRLIKRSLTLTTLCESTVLCESIAKIKIKRASCPQTLVL